MYTKEAFTSRWQRLHHPSMDVRSDVAFYYGLYCQLRAVIGQEAWRFHESEILRLLLYVENTIAIGLDGVYAYRYRHVGDVVAHACDQWRLSASSSSRVDRLVSQAVADATSSSLRRWMMETVLSGMFPWLSGMLTWLVREDRVLRLALPDLRFRKTMFRRLMGDKWQALRMLWADIAFHWRDKRGYSLAAAIAERFRHPFPIADGMEKSLLGEVADALDSLRAERLDTYTVLARKEDRVLTLRHRDGRVFTDVVFPTIVPAEGHFLAAQLVTYQGRTYVSGPVRWLSDSGLAEGSADRLWTEVIRQEREAARQRYFTTPFGKRVCLYDDLYTIPEDPDEARDADWGIYWDEPTIFDFLSPRFTARLRSLNVCRKADVKYPPRGRRQM